jgi:hypothetical protein
MLTGLRLPAGRALFIAIGVAGLACQHRHVTGQPIWQEIQVSAFREVARNQMEECTVRVVRGAGECGLQWTGTSRPVDKAADGERVYSSGRDKLRCGQERSLCSLPIRCVCGGHNDTEGR